MRHIHLFTVAIAIFLFAHINAQESEQILGRLLTQKEGCGLSKVASPRIVDGTPAKPGTFPWIVLLGNVGRKGAKHFKCGGSLITSRHVLTAAHCIRDGLSFVRVGEPASEELPHQEINIIRKDVHPNFTDILLGDGTNDIAILTLEHDVEFNDLVRPVCLPSPKVFKTMSFSTQSPFVAGFGIMEYENGTRENTLMQLQVPVVPNEKCEALYRANYVSASFTLKTSQFDESVLCAGRELRGPGTCCGDAGMALVIPFFENGEFPMYQIGVVSWGFNHRVAKVPGVYTRVTHFMDWIQQIINQQ